MNLKHGEAVSVIRQGKPVLRDRIVYVNYLGTGRARTSTGLDLLREEENITWCRGWAEDSDKALAVAQGLK